MTNSRTSTLSKPTPSFFKVPIPAGAAPRDILTSLQAARLKKVGNTPLKLLLVDEEPGWQADMESVACLQDRLEKLVGGKTVSKVAWITQRDRSFCLGLSVQLRSKLLKDRFSVFENESEALEWIHGG